VQLNKRCVEKIRESARNPADLVLTIEVATLARAEDEESPWIANTEPRYAADIARS
jgi:hypothetical protein